MKKSIDNVTGVVVSYNTKELLERSLNSVRNFYPDLKIIVIDGSQPGNSCYDFVRKLGGGITPVSVGYNIGHGKGMDMGIKLALTDFVLVFDSDIVLKGRPIEKMMRLLEEDTFGVGEIQFVNKKGKNVKRSKKAIPYLHPYFQIINKSIYAKFPGYVHHGAPCILTMMEIKRRGMSEKILKDFPVSDFVRHQWEGTRALDPVEFRSGWVSYPGGGDGIFKKAKKWLRKKIRDVFS